MPEGWRLVWAVPRQRGGRPERAPKTIATPTDNSPSARGPAYGEHAPSNDAALDTGLALADPLSSKIPHATKELDASLRMVKSGEAIAVILFNILAAAVLLAAIRASAVNIGEFRVRRALRHLDRSTYIVLHDLLVKRVAPRYGTSQIDHVIVSCHGIFVIETKRYTGSIFGGPRDARWTQRNHQKSFSFEHPIRQNFGHVRALQELLGTRETGIIFVPLVVFAGSASVRVSDARKHGVMGVAALVDVIHEYQEATLPPDLLSEIAAQFRSANLTVTQVQREQWNHTAKVLQRECPRCGAVLVERTGRYGAFLGCANYPTCRFHAPLVPHAGH